MRLLLAPLPVAWATLGWLLLTPLVARSALRVRSERVLHGAQQHLWLAGVVLLAWMWTLQSHAAGAAPFGLLGAAFYALIFGRDLARLGLLAAVAVHTAFAGGCWANFGAAGLLLAAIPTAIVAMLQRFLERRLPRNLFVFMIGNGMFVTLAATAATSLLLVAAHWVQQPATASADQVAYALLLAWGEALATGMLFSALVVFAPYLVLTYRQDLYLPPRRSR
jgi:uncharacterized membrane protein